MSNLALSLVLAVLVLVLAWNFIPSLRSRMRGLSTIVEATIGVALTYFGAFTDAIKEAQAAGYLPQGFEKYVPAILFFWIVMKRFQTKTPVGTPKAKNSIGAKSEAAQMRRARAGPEHREDMAVSENQPGK